MLGSPGPDRVPHRRRQPQLPTNSDAAVTALPLGQRSPPFGAGGGARLTHDGLLYGSRGAAMRRPLPMACPFPASAGGRRRARWVWVACGAGVLMATAASLRSGLRLPAEPPRVLLLVPQQHPPPTTATARMGPRLPTPPPTLAAGRGRPNYGGIDYAPIVGGEGGRAIHGHDRERHARYRAELLRRMDRQTPATHSDQERAIEADPARFEHYDELELPPPSGCLRPQWSFATHLNCNDFHGVSLGWAKLPDAHAAKYLSEGSFRLAWLLEDAVVAAAMTAHGSAASGRGNSLVMKNLRMALEWNALTMKQVHLEAAVMAQTLPSRATADIYGHCGTSTLVETGQSIRNSVFYSQSLMAAADVRRKQAKYGTTSLNRLTDEQRLKLALQMAESLADMHGNPNGVIVNDDLQVFQWVVCKDNRIVLNDFNNAIIMEWDTERNAYCKFSNTFSSVYRSPQENTGEPTDESADVHVLGSMYYNLLTGLMPFYQEESYRDALKALVEKRHIPFIDPAFRNGTMIQRSLVGIMESCWHYESGGRISVFDVLRRLRETVVAYEASHPGVKINAIDLKPLGRPL